ncbi:cell envelope integrity protein TolA [Pararhizobium sp.]|uniref:cell envelope integrity protein TolA n=1 Tax=Pararhizobium sp. TaxID=1977563 RepID=UPI00271D2CD9|nr:energy transducer TonB [Pararhizobium sp.]MDO9414965.1 energy transducer TonB [Pararhizobium sp.]
MNSAAKWTGAIVFSLIAHGVAATLLMPAPPGREEALIAGGEVTEITMLGNAFEETIEAGDPTDPVDPLETPVEEVEPVETEPVETQPEEIAPVTEDIPVETAEAIQPVIADLAVPVEDLPPEISVEPLVTAAVQPVEEIKPVDEPEKKKIEKPVEKKKVVKKPKPKKPVEKKPEVKKKVVKKASGSQGDSAERRQKGTEQGVEGAKSAKATGNAKASARQAGNAAVTNYPGKVRSKLNRAFRYPSAAQRERLRGTALVRFTVNSGGGVSGVSIARSAGSSILDQAAMDTVRRASPFPKIPEGAGKSSWTFTVPLAFSR